MGWGCGSSRYGMWDLWMAPKRWREPGSGGCGRGDRGGGWMRTGRTLAGGDLRLVILALLAEKPRHGYDLIKALEERSQGGYSPSPGVVYPTLTFLEEAGYARVEVDGSRKLYSITDEGRELLERNRAMADALIGRIAELGMGRRGRRERERDTRFEWADRFVREERDERADWQASPEPPPRSDETPLERALGILVSAVRAATGSEPGAAERIAKVLDDAAQRIRGNGKPS